MKAREFDKVVEKFRFKTRRRSHLLAWLEIDGRLAVRTRRSNKKGTLPCSHQIRQQLKLSEQELANAISCDLDYDGYVGILRQKEVI